MFKSLILGCCLTTNQDQTTPDQSLHRFPQGLTSNEMVGQVSNFETIRAQFVPHLLQELGPEIKDLLYNRAFDPQAQFINRYMNAVALRLACTPENERDEAVEAIKLLIPASEAEYEFIHGTYLIRRPSQHQIGQTTFWPLKHNTITQRIAQIKSELLSKKTQPK